MGVSELRKINQMIGQIAGEDLGDLKPLTLQQWPLEPESYPPQLPAHQHFENTSYLFIQVGIS